MKNRKKIVCDITIFRNIYSGLLKYYKGKHYHTFVAICCVHDNYDNRTTFHDPTDEFSMEFVQDLYRKNLDTFKRRTGKSIKRYKKELNINDIYKTNISIYQFLKSLECCYHQITGDDDFIEIIRHLINSIYKDITQRSALYWKTK